MLSGYFAAKSLHTENQRFASFARTKLNTLIIPFLFWNFFILAIVLVVKQSGIAEHFRGGGAYFDVELNPISIACAVLGINRDPIVYQFWFLRDLIVVSFVVFLLRQVIFRVPLLPWLMLLVPLPFASSLGYFLLGHSLRNLLPTENFPKTSSSLLFCLGWLAIGLGVHANWVNVPYPLHRIGSACFMFMISVALSSFKGTRGLALLGSATFFIFATHEPLQTILSKTWQIIGLPYYGSLFFYLTVFSMTLVMVLAGYFMLRRFAPGFLSMATGSRSRPKSLGSTPA